MSLKYAILGLLSEERRYGYEIKQLFDHRFGEVWSISYGQLYPTLKKLLEYEYIEKKVEQGEKAAERNVYSITKKGARFFSEWLHNDTRPPRISVKDDFTLSTLFFEKLNTHEIEEKLRKQLEILSREQVALLKKIEAASKKTFFQQVVLKKILFHINAEILWVEELLNTIKNEKGAHSFKN